MAEAKFSVKRSTPRFLFSAEAEAILRDGRAIAAQVFELSLHGCYIDTIEPIPVGTKLDLHVRNGDGFVELPARVIYVHNGAGMGVYGMGLVFENVQPEQSFAIETRLRELALEKSGTKPTLESS